MKKIKITRGGCGISYEDAHGVKRHALKTPESGPFDCDDAQADRLVRLGVAAYVGVGDKPTPESSPVQEPAAGAEGTAKSHLDAAELENWDYNQLKKLAADMGVEPKGKKKADYIAAIAAAEIEPGDEDDELPELDAADPE